MTARAAEDIHHGRLEADARVSGLKAGADRDAGEGVALSDASLDAVAGGAPQRFYPLAELFRMVTGMR